MIQSKYLPSSMRPGDLQINFEAKSTSKQVAFEAGHSKQINSKFVILSEGSCGLIARAVVEGPAVAIAVARFASHHVTKCRNLPLLLLNYIRTSPPL